MNYLLLYMNWAFIPATLLFAAIWGGRDERIAVVIILLALIGTHFAVTKFSLRYSSIELQVLFVDALMGGALVALALSSDRFWPIWATSFHLLSIFTHLAMLLTQHIIAFPYAFLAGWWAWPTQAALAIGVLEYRRRLKFQKMSGDTVMS